MSDQGLLLNAYTVHIFLDSTIVKLWSSHLMQPGFNQTSFCRYTCFSSAVIHVPAVERPRFLPQSKRTSQRSEATESPHQQSECLIAFGLKADKYLFSIYLQVTQTSLCNSSIILMGDKNTFLFGFFWSLIVQGSEIFVHLKLLVNCITQSEELYKLQFISMCLLQLERFGNLCFCLQNGELKLADFGLARAFGIPVRCYSAEVGCTLQLKSDCLKLKCKMCEIAFIFSTFSA